MLIPILINGVGYAVFESAFWVSITYAVPEKLVGSAYGIATVFGNISGVLAPLAVAWLQSEDYSSEGTQQFTYSMWFFIFMCAVAEGLLLCLYLDDVNNRDGNLNKVHS